jgi:hypothetical protein
VNDKLSSKEIAELREIAEWLDSVYTRLDGSIFAFALQMGNEKYHQLLQGDIEEAVKIGIAMNRSMENCGCLFELLNGTDRPPIEYIMRARSEVNNLAIAVRQLAIDEPVSESDCKYPGLREMYQAAQNDTNLSKQEKSYRKVAERYRKTLDTNDRPTVEILKRWLERPGNH